MRPKRATANAKFQYLTLPIELSQTAGWLQKVQCWLVDGGVAVGRLMRIICVIHRQCRLREWTGHSAAATLGRALRAAPFFTGRHHRSPIIALPF